LALEIGGKIDGNRIDKTHLHIGKQAQIMPTFSSTIVQREEVISTFILSQCFIHNAQE
jgi:hypothetical protein